MCLTLKMFNTSVNCSSTPAIIISEISKKEREINESPDCLRKTKSPNLSSSPASYDESLKFLSHSLEQICGRGSHSSLNCVGVKDGPPKSPIIQISSRPQSFHLAMTNAVKATPTQGNYIRKDSDGTIMLKVRHNETHEKLQQSLSKICSSPGSTSSSVQKRISDAQENLKSKFRVKVDVSKHGADLNNIYITIDPQRNLTVNHLLESGNSVTSKPSIKDLHTCKVPESISLERILCSFQEGPSLYLRPSGSSFTEFYNTNFRCVPVMHTNEDSQTFTITLRLPTEIFLENTEVKRVDDKLTIRAFGFRLSDTNGRISQVESSVNFQIDLPEESDGRSLTARIFTSRILVIEGKLLPTSRRMTCKFWLLTFLFL